MDNNSNNSNVDFSFGPGVPSQNPYALGGPFNPLPSLTLPKESTPSVVDPLTGEYGPTPTMEDSTPSLLAQQEQRRQLNNLGMFLYFANFPAQFARGRSETLEVVTSEGNGEVVPSPVPDNAGATFGRATSTNYRGTFFKANPGLEGKVVVHHAVEQQVLTRYPGAVTEEQIHSLENLRGIPNEVNSDLHLSQIRREWNQFYRQTPNATQEQLLQKATEIDTKYGSKFNPPLGQ